MALRGLAALDPAVGLEPRAPLGRSVGDGMTPYATTETRIVAERIAQEEADRLARELRQRGHDEAHRAIADRVRMSPRRL